METANTSYRVHRCSKYLRDNEYYCNSYECDLCHECKEHHVKDTKTHNVVRYREKIKYIPRQEICAKHPQKMYMWYCELCQVPVCYSCKTHRKHIKKDIRTIYRRERQQLKRTVQIIRSKSLFYSSIFLSRIKHDIKTIHTKVSFHQADILKKAQRLKFLIDDALCDVKLKRRCLKQKIELNKEIASIQEY